MKDKVIKAFFDFYKKADKSADREFAFCKNLTLIKKMDESKQVIRRLFVKSEVAGVQTTEDFTQLETIFSLVRR